MDSVYAGHDMMDARKIYKKFIGAKKGSSQSINKFKGESEREYVKAKKAVCKFSDTILAFNLMMHVGY